MAIPTEGARGRGGLCSAGAVVAPRSPHPSGGGLRGSKIAITGDESLQRTPPVLFLFQGKENGNRTQKGTTGEVPKNEQTELSKTSKTTKKRGETSKIRGGSGKTQQGQESQKKLGRKKKKNS